MIGVPVDAGLAVLSDRLVLLTVLVYSLAMLAYAADMASLKGRAPVATRVATYGPDAQQGPQPTEPPGGSFIGGVAIGLTLLGWALQGGAMLARGLAAHRWPWGNMYEFVVAITFAAVTTFLVLLLRQPVRYLGTYVMIPVVLGVGLASMVLRVEAGPLVPALNSYWIAIHVTAAIVATGVFTVGAAVAVLYLVAERYEKLQAVGGKVGFSGVARRLPGPETLDQLTHRTIVFAFPIWTFAVIAGAIWADAAWGRFWGWDPKETWSFVTWLAYAAYLHARLTVGWRGRRAAVLALVAYGCLLFNLIGVNMFISGLHSYAGI